MVLTPKQEVFVQELIKGASQRQAYRTAYGCANWKESSIDRKACEMFANVKVKTRYNELMEKATQNFIWNYERAQNELLELLNDSKGAKDRKHILQAIKELNQISGIYKRDNDTDKSINITIKKASDSK